MQVHIPTSDEGMLSCRFYEESRTYWLATKDQGHDSISDKILQPRDLRFELSNRSEIW